MIIKVRYPMEKQIVMDSQSSSRNNISNINYRNKFYPENTNFLDQEDDIKKRKNISLPKITNSPQYNNPYNPNDLTVNYFDKEEKNKYQEFKTNLSSLKNKNEAKTLIKNSNNEPSFIKKHSDINLSNLKNKNEANALINNSNNEPPSLIRKYSDLNHYKEKKKLPPIQNVRSNSNEKVQHPIKLYSIKDYEEIKKNFNFIIGIEKGGLGPCRKDDKWNEKQKLIDKMMKFSHDVKVINTSKIVKYLEESVTKEQSFYNKNLNVSKRQKGWEFAKNIELPKTYKKQQKMERIMEKDDLEDTLEFYEQRHIDLSKKVEKNKGRKF